MGARKQQLIDWLSQQSGREPIHLTPLDGGASFRRFFRFSLNHQTYIAMDAPPDRENSQRYVNLTAQLSALGLAIPTIFGADTHQGFIWLSDFGDTLYFRHLNRHNVDALYRAAFAPLLTLQQATTLDLPAFTHDILCHRLAGFRHTFIEAYLGLTLSPSEQQVINDTFAYLIKAVLSQPQVPIHYDYHSQNLLLLDDGTTGIVDFQDAQKGPITYDLVSLLRDCYVAWPRVQVRAWVADYYAQLQHQQIITANISRQQFNEWFDLTGMKRHLRASFVFARKWLRDNDASYLAHLPRTLHYVRATCEDYPQLAPFQQLLEQTLIPTLALKQQETA